MPKRVLQGVVVSDKNDKTVVVRVDRRFTHPLLQKTVRRSKNYHAHDEKNEFKVGEMVWIEECPPISKQKRWTVMPREQATTSRQSAHCWTGLPPTQGASRNRAGHAATAQLRKKRAGRLLSRPLLCLARRLDYLPEPGP